MFHFALQADISDDSAQPAKKKKRRKLPNKDMALHPLVTQTPGTN